MEPAKDNPSQLELLPQDLLGDIMARVAARSCEDYVNAISACRELGLTRNDERVAHKVSLEPLKRKPLHTFLYRELMEKWLHNKNADAQYIQGIIEYFALDDKTNGLHHLQSSADGGCDEATYLFGTLRLGLGHTEVGKHYLDKLDWRNDISVAKKCWDAIRASFGKLHLSRDPSFVMAVNGLKPIIYCDHIHYSCRCEKCFYYMVLYKFNSYIKFA